MPTALEVAPREGRLWLEPRHQLFKGNVELAWLESYVKKGGRTSGKRFQIKQLRRCHAPDAPGVPDAPAGL